MGLHQSGMSDERKTFPWFGVLNFVKQNRCHQHRIDPLLVRRSDDHRFELFELIEGQVAKGLELVHPPSEQLRQRRLRAMDPEPLLQELQFLGRENGWIRLLISLYQLVHRHPFLDRRFGCRRRENESQTQDQGSTALQEFTHGSDPGLRANRS